MRITVQLSVIPDGSISHVHMVVTDLDDRTDKPWRLETAYQSGIIPPHFQDNVRYYVQRVLVQLAARVQDGALIDRTDRRPYVEDVTPPL